MKNRKVKLSLDMLSITNKESEILAHLKIQNIN